MEETLVLTKRRNQWGEYKIKYFRDGKEIEEGSYYTEDWDDAFNTLKHMAKCMFLSDWFTMGKTIMVK